MKNEIEALPVIEVVELDWLVAYSLLISSHQFAAAQKVLDWFMPKFAE